MRSIVFGCMAVLSCSILAGCGKSSSVKNVERVLNEDAKTAAGANSIAEIVSRMRAIDLDGCPQDFTLAYISHIHAWESAILVEREAAAFKANFDSSATVMEAFIRGLALDVGMFGEAELPKIA